MPIPTWLRTEIISDEIPTTMSLHLLSALPNKAGTGYTEFPIADGYVAGVAEFGPAVVDGKITLANEVVFGPATDDWPDGVGWLLKNGGGDTIGWAETPIIAPNGATVTFKIGSIVIQVLDSQ